MPLVGISKMIVHIFHESLMEHKKKSDASKDFFQLCEQVSHKNSYLQNIETFQDFLMSLVQHSSLYFRHITKGILIQDAKWIMTF